MLSFTDGVGVDAVLETVGSKNLARSLNVLRTGGSISIMGLLGGSKMTIDALSLMERHATIRGMEVGNTQDFQDMDRAILLPRGSANKQHDLHPVIDRTFTADIPQAESLVEPLGTRIERK